VVLGCDFCGFSGRFFGVFEVVLELMGIGDLFSAFFLFF